MISVIIATKNGSGRIRKSIKSIQNQTEKDVEIIVVSDGSTDNTANIVRICAEQDPRIKLIELKQNIGPGRARDLAIRENSSGEYVAFLDDDDIWVHPEKLMWQKEYLNEHPNVAAVGSAAIDFVDDFGKHIRWVRNEKSSAKIRQHMLSYNPFIASSVLMRKNAYLEFGGFKDMYLNEDYDLWLRIGQKYDLANIETNDYADKTAEKMPDIQYMVRLGGATRSRALEMCRVVLGLVKEYRPFYGGYLYAYAKARLRILILLFKNLF